jgi:curved DNA-binding protein CbpA
MMAAHPDRCPDNVERATQQAQGINEAKEFILKITALTKSE